MNYIKIIKKGKSTCFEYCRGNIRQVGDSDILRSISIQLLLFAFALTFKALYANFSRKAKKTSKIYFGPRIKQICVKRNDLKKKIYFIFFFSHRSSLDDPHVDEKHNPFLVYAGTADVIEFAASWDPLRYISPSLSNAACNCTSIPIQTAVTPHILSKQLLASAFASIKKP